MGWRCNPVVLQYVKDQTPDICMAAVKKQGLALHYVNDNLRTPDICMEAVVKNPMALLYVSQERQTEEMCMEAVRISPMALCIRKIPNP